MATVANLILFMLSLTAIAQDIVDDPSLGPGMQKMTFTTPEHTEEQKESSFMPPELQCDGCKAVAHQIFEAFQLFNKRHKNLKYKLPESDVLTILDELCEENVGKQFESYGMKVIDGKAILSGPGLEGQDMPGIMAGGGKWPSRLMKMCEEFRGELDDMNIYTAYKKSPENSKSLTSYLCNGSGLQGACSEGIKRKTEL